MSKKELSYNQRENLEETFKKRFDVQGLDIKWVKLDAQNYSDIVMSSLDCQAMAFNAIIRRVLQIILKNPMTSSKNVFLARNEDIGGYDIQNGWQEVTQDYLEQNKEELSKLMIV